MAAVPGLRGDLREPVSNSTEDDKSKSRKKSTAVQDATNTIASKAGPALSDHIKSADPRAFDKLVSSPKNKYNNSSEKSTAWYVVKNGNHQLLHFPNGSIFVLCEGVLYELDSAQKK